MGSKALLKDRHPSFTHKPVPLHVYFKKKPKSYFQSTHLVSTRESTEAEAIFFPLLDIWLVIGWEGVS